MEALRPRWEGCCSVYWVAGGLATRWELAWGCWANNGSGDLEEFPGGSVVHALTTKDLGSVPHRRTKIPQAVAWSQRRPPEPPGQAARGRGACGRGGGCELQTWRPHTEQLPEGLRAPSRARGLQSEWTAGGCGRGEGPGLFGTGCRKAAPRLSQRGRVWAGG